MTTRTRTKRHAIAAGPLRAVAYVRLSKAKSKPGDTEVGLETQLVGCERAVAAMAGSIVAVEQDIQSGDRLDRHGLWRAIERVRSGEANAIIVYTLDRFGRDSVQQGVAVHAIRKAGGRLLSATQNLEDGPIGEFVRHAYELAAAIELANIRERTNRALAAKFQQTQSLKPGHRPPYGYRKVGTGATATYEIDPAEAGIVRRIFRERAAGASIRGIVAGLRRDGVPSATSRGRWGEAMIRNVLTRRTYWTGKHECWRTCTVRDADNVPWLEKRPAEERYTAKMPTIIDPALAARAQSTAERNIWKSRRDDRAAEIGILRYGFARCATCGRVMMVATDKSGHAHYRCLHTSHPDRPCAASPSLAVEKLDGPFLNWLQGIIEDPSRAEAYRVERKSAVPDVEALAAAKEAERHVAEIERNIAKLIETQLVAEDFAAELLAAKINDFSTELRTARAERDRLAAACRVSVTEDAPALVPQDVLAAAILDAIEAMIAADLEPDQTFNVLLRVPEGLAEYTVPLSWKAWQAALSVLGVVVTVAPAKSELPRWVADVRPRGDIAVTTAGANSYLGMTP